MKIPDLSRMDKLLRIEHWWLAYRDRALIWLSYLMALLSFLKLGDEFARLLYDFRESSAVDLEIFVMLSRDWFAGVPVYELYSSSLYPPASYIILWPLFGAFPESVVRLLWAALSAGLLIWLAKFSVRAGNAQSKQKKRWFLALIPLSMNAAGVAIGNGQLSLLVIPMIWLSVFLASNDEIDKHKRWLSVPLFIIALVKPSLAVPFFWIILFSPNTFSYGLAVGAAYWIATLFSIQFQIGTLRDLSIQWLARATDVIGGYANIQTWLHSGQLEILILPLQLVFLLLLGWWVYVNRKIDIYILAGVVAIFSRFWTYHAVYDDVVVIFAILAIYRISQKNILHFPYRFPLDWWVGINILVMLAPARMRYFPQPFEFLFKGGHTIVWLTDLFLLMYVARHTADVAD